MASRALLQRCVNGNINNNCRLITRTLADSTKDGKPATKLAAIVAKDVKDFLKTKDEILYQEGLKGTITVPAIEDVWITSGVPEDHIKTRRVRIYQPAKNAMQSGRNNTHHWQIDFDTRERWENPLIGWTSTGDPMSNLQVQFSSEKEAIEHCQKMGWTYFIQKPNEDNPKPRSYGSNFAWNKRTRVSTK